MKKQAYKEYTGYFGGSWITVDNEPFEEVLELKSFERGRSSTQFIFRSVDTDKRYYMFVSDFTDLVKSNTLENGRIEGIFQYCKKGQNIGIKQVKGKIVE